MQLHALFGEEAGEMDQARSDMLAQISAFKPQESIFEIGLQGQKARRNNAAEIMKTMRQKVGPRRAAKPAPAMDEAGELDAPGPEPGLAESEADEPMGDDTGFGSQSESDADPDITVINSEDHKVGKSSWRDSDVFMSYMPRTTNVAEERGYGVHSGASHPTLPK